MNENENIALKENSPVYGSEGDDIDLSLFRLSLAMTPSERMQANDDAVNFADALRDAMVKHMAKLSVASDGSKN